MSALNKGYGQQDEQEYPLHLNTNLRSSLSEGLNGQAATWFSRGWINSISFHHEEAIRLVWNVYVCVVCMCGMYVWYMCAHSLSHSLTFPPPISYLPPPPPPPSSLPSPQVLHHRPLTPPLNHPHHPFLPHQLPPPPLPPLPLPLPKLQLPRLQRLLRVLYHPIHSLPERDRALRVDKERVGDMEKERGRNERGEV